MPLLTITKYCNEDDLKRLLSTAGVHYRADDNDDMEDDDVISDQLTEASELINMHCERYSAAVLATSNLINRWATVIAARLLCSTRGNPVPTSIEDRYKEVLEWLDKIHHGKLDLPGIAVASQSIPTVSNLRIDGRYNNQISRVQRDLSTGGTSSLPTKVDVNEMPDAY